MNRRLRAELNEKMENDKTQENRTNVDRAEWRDSWKLK